MLEVIDQRVLGALLNSWDRSNTILLGLLRALPPGGLGARAVGGGPSVAEMFTHIHSVRLVLVAENAPEFAGDLPEEEWLNERDPGRTAQTLEASAQVVRNAVGGRVEAGQDMDLHYDPPVLLMQHTLWHEGYHHGQIKLVLRGTGQPASDQEAGPVTWGVWMRKTRAVH